jgi:uncharacterized protein DUF6188
MADIPDDQRRLNEALALVVGKRVTLFMIDWSVGLSFTDPGAGQNFVIETPFTIGPPGDEAPVVPGEYGPSIARVIALLGETVTVATTDPTMLDLVIEFESGSRISVVRQPLGSGWAHEVEWEYRDGSGSKGLWIVY